MHLIVKSLLSAALAMTCWNAVAQDNTWHRGNAPYGADRVTVAPANANRAMVRGGRFLFLTSDGGATWSEVSRGLPENLIPNEIIADPDNADRWMVAISQRLWETTDAGNSWRIAVELPLSATRLPAEDTNTT